MGPEHPALARMRANLGQVQSVLGRVEKASHNLQIALELREKARGPGHPDVARSLEALAGLALRLGRYREAVHLSRRALGIFQKALGREAAEVATTLERGGLALLRQGRVGEAIADFERALALQEKRHGPRSARAASTRSTLGEAFLAARRVADAERLLRDADAVLSPAGDRLMIGLTRLRLACVLRERGKLGAAEVAARSAAVALERALGTADPILGRALRELGETLLRARRGPEAVQALERAAAIHERRPCDPRDLARTRFALARALWATGTDRARARRLADAAHSTLASSESPPPRELAQLAAWIARSGRRP
jgi:tetratricopeptide (TPR) repeat protein